MDLRGDRSPTDGRGTLGGTSARCARRVGWQPLAAPTGPPDPTLAASGFTRLARVHALSTAVDTLVATSLAGSLFFSIPTGEARGRVALYLLLTIAPFAIVGPVLGPVLRPGQGRAPDAGDRHRPAPRRRVRADGALPRHPPRSSRSPSACSCSASPTPSPGPRSCRPSWPTTTELVEANAKLSLLSGDRGFRRGRTRCADAQAGRAPSGCSCWPPSSPPPRPLAAAQLPRTQVAAEPADQVEEDELHSHGVVLASEAMGVLRGVVGFLTFLLAFALRGGGDDTPVPVGLALGRVVRSVAGFEVAPADGGSGASPTWHFGVVIGVSVFGALIGALVAPRLRDAMSEERILQGALVGTIVCALARRGARRAPRRGRHRPRASASRASAGKLAFDSIVQRDAPDANRGRSFAMFETRFQLFWVLGGFIPVVVALPARVGYLVVAGAAGFALFSYLAGLRGHGPPAGAPSSPPVGTPAAEAALRRRRRPSPPF